MADDAAATVAALGTHVNDVVRHLDDVHVVLDDEDGVALVDELVEYVHQHLDVLEVEAGGGLVKHVERLACVALGQLGGQLHALRLATADGGGGLAEGEVTQADVFQCPDFLYDARYVLEELHRLVDGHVEHVVDRLALVAHLEGLAVVALALAFLAQHRHVGKEVHLDDAHARALAGLAAPALDVERESSRLVVAYLRLGQLAIELADVVEHLSICGGVGAWRAPDGGLVDLDDLVDVLQALDAVVGQRLLHRAVEPLAEDGGEGLIN